MRAGTSPRITRAAVRGAVVGLVYFAVSAAWIAFSDRYVELLAGGTDLIVNMRRQIDAPNSLIDLAGIDELMHHVAADIAGSAGHEGRH